MGQADRREEILQMTVDLVMQDIDAEDEDRATVRSVVERMVRAGYEKTRTCDPLGYDD